jgi:hypothetical protein
LKSSRPFPDADLPDIRLTACAKPAKMVSLKTHPTPHCTPDLAQPHPAIGFYHSLMNGTHFEVKRQKDRVELRPLLAQLRPSPGTAPMSAYRESLAQRQLRRQRRPQTATL